MNRSVRGSSYQANNMKCVRVILEENFKRLGCYTAKHPCLFTLCPLMLSLLLTTGIQKAKLLQDIESLYAPTTSISIKGRAYLESHFPTNLSSTFNPERYTREGSFGAVIVVAKDGGSILRPHIFKAIIRLDQKIQKMKIYWDDRFWSYKDICVKWHSACVRDTIFSQGNMLANDNYENNTNFKPWFKPSSFYVGYTSTEGNSKEDVQKSTKALRLIYYLNDSTESRRRLSDMWEESFTNRIKSLRFTNISFHVLSSSALENIYWTTFRRSALYILILLCSIAVCWPIIAFKESSFQGKPWMGVVVAVSSGLAVTSGHGLLMYCDIYFVPSSVIAAIVILGITTVDTLVMISIWKWTDSKKTVEDRLGDTYAVVGVPITASFFVNFLSLLIGTAFSPFREFSIFCFYTSSCLALRFLYQMTVIGGSMAAFGYAEKRNLHSFTFRPVPVTSFKERQFSCRICCDRSPEENNRNNTSVSSSTAILESVRKTIAYTQTKSFLIILYLVYLATSIWGTTKLENDYTLNETVTGDAYVNSYFQKLRENFGQYRDRIQVALNTTLNYADPSIQDKINRMMDAFESAEYGNFHCKSWLRNYLEFLSDKKLSYVMKNYNITDKNDFIHVLRHHFLRYSGSEYASDVIFNEGTNDITASRFLLRSYTPISEEDYWNAVERIRQVSNERYFSTVVYGTKLYVYEGTDISLATTLILLCTKALVITVVCSIAFCGIMHAVITCFSFTSVSLGVLGYLALWNVGMNPLSFKYIICFSILSVNFLTHSAHGYAVTNKKTKKMELIILKGSILSVAAVVAALIRPLWTLSSAFKIGFLTCLFSALHATCFHTTASSLYDSLNCRINKWSASSCSKDRKCRIPGKFRHPAFGGIYNGTVVISHIDIGS